MKLNTSRHGQEGWEPNKKDRREEKTVFIKYAKEAKAVSYAHSVHTDFK